MKGLRIAALLTVAIMATAAACSSSSSSSTSSTATSPSSATGGGGGASKATITVANFTFDPSSVDVSSGKVTLTVTNNDTTEHTFTLDDGSSDTPLPAGQTQKVTLNLTQTVGWHCTIHPSMTGTLNVG
jgi:plastocyanin